MRTYTTRHGPGPFVTEDPALDRRAARAAQRHGRWQGAFRVGHFDAVAQRYAVEVAAGSTHSPSPTWTRPRPGPT